jgi:phosphatidylserine/phosphatidylglycerophosphate/cardiolipin synthase-like enzyme
VRADALLPALALAACVHGATLELVESVPVETTLDRADIRDAADVWPELVDAAGATLDLGEFYASDVDTGPSRLEATVAAIERAAARGVRVRFLADADFAVTYPTTLARLRAAGVEVRTVDFERLAGGRMHAKYFIVDGRTAFVGSQNFDWRALEHIQEMGVVVGSRAIAAQLGAVFETDWSGGRVRRHSSVPVRASDGARVELVASPAGWLPDETSWDLPRLVAAIDATREEVAVQVLTYDGGFALDDALRRAAARGARVRLLVSHWATRPDRKGRAALAALAAVPGVEVRVITIPPWSDGEIPYARVAHSKIALFDRRAAWIGTSNWEEGYFTRSRNVGVLVEGGRLPGRLAGVFDATWASGYTARLSAGP